MFGQSCSASLEALSREAVLRTWNAKWVRTVGMDAQQASKLGRYFRNSQKFLWGLSGNNQRKTYEWLRRKGFGFKGGSYGDVSRQLLEDPGIERLLKCLIIPRVTKKFSEASLGYLRACWFAGTMPDLSLLRSYNVRDASPFVEVNTQFNYVERWGEFAGPWFEEIEAQPADENR